MATEVRRKNRDTQRSSSVDAERAAFAAPLPEGLCPLSPMELAARVASRPGSFWFDSADAEIGVDAWSFVGVRAERIIGCEESSDRAPIGSSFLDLLHNEMAGLRIQPADRDEPLGPPFHGGWFALLGYDLGREIERIPKRAVRDLPFQGLFLARHPLVMAFSHREGRWWASGSVSAGLKGARRHARLAELAKRLLADVTGASGPTSGVTALEARSAHDGPCVEAHVPRPRTVYGVLPDGVTSTLSRERYEKAVRRALDYIVAGDIYQVNLSQRFEVGWRASAFELYRRMRRESPARFGVFANLGEGRAVCSISPELFLRVQRRAVVTRPIKGTRPRGANRDEDARLRDELAVCGKERAELNMIVDLERNDLGRVCEYGSVQVMTDGEIEEHPTVFHRVAGVAGRLRRGVDAAALIRATFPGGSVSGAPKIRAMEIIEELEPTRRGPYCGSLGWLGADGDLELNIAIRSALVDERAGRAWYQAGGGIVADSDPAREYEETLDKAAAFFRAITCSASPPMPASG